MVKDRKAISASKPNHFFALKVQKSAEHYTEAAMDEVELLDCISKERKKVEQLATNGGKDKDGVPALNVMENSQYVAELHDSFFHTGPNGRHMCMVFSMLGCNLLSVIKAYNYRGIPLPVVKNMINGICRGLDFLHRKCEIIHTDLKPENVLILFEGEEEDKVSNLSNSMASMSMENKSDKRNPLAQSIHELEVQLEGKNMSQDERKKLRRRLKKKRQKERKRTFGTDDGGASDDDDDDDDDMDSIEEILDEDDASQKDSSSFLSDWEMSKILSNAANMISPRSADSGVLPTTPNVKRRLSHSAFVTTNFGHRQVAADSKLMELLRDSVSVKRPSADELEADLRAAEKNGGVAEVAFMLRAFTPEEELADGLSSALGGIAWEMQASDKSTREW
jgi:hypothetical protein